MRKKESSNKLAKKKLLITSIINQFICKHLKTPAAKYYKKSTSYYYIYKQLLYNDDLLITKKKTYTKIVSQLMLQHSNKLVSTTKHTVVPFF